ncbi:MAG: hypothetical protein EHM22_03435 [Actinobacteria bacterium]|nr:MAG: hypothetical protein EHM22_03435 [Actinomycetota bacterium]
MLAATEALGIGIVVSGFLFGFRHGIDWDHIAAITDITSSQEERGRALEYGTIYALGHALVVLVIGVVAIALGARLPEGVDEVMGRIVGVTLIALGIYVFAALVRHGREFRMRSRWMLIFSGVHGAYRKVRGGRRREAHELEPVHRHADQAGTVSVAVAEDIPVSEWHHGHHGRPGHHHHKHPEPTDDAFMNYGRGTAFGVGMLHGIGAETPDAGGHLPHGGGSRRAGGRRTHPRRLPDRPARVEHPHHARVRVRLRDRVEELDPVRHDRGPHGDGEPGGRDLVLVREGCRPARLLRRVGINPRRRAPSRSRHRARRWRSG